MNTDYEPPIDVVPTVEYFSLNEEPNTPTENTEIMVSSEEVSEEKTDLEVFEDTVDAFIEKDMLQARKNLLGLLESAEEGVKSLLLLAQATDHPRAYEVLATMLKTAQDMNKDLLDVHKKKKELSGKSAIQAAEVINNNQYVFHGTAQEMQEMMDEEEGDD